MFRRSPHPSDSRAASSPWGTLRVTLVAGVLPTAYSHRTCWAMVGVSILDLGSERWHLLEGKVPVDGMTTRKVVVRSAVFGGEVVSNGWMEDGVAGGNIPPDLVGRRRPTEHGVLCIKVGMESLGRHLALALALVLAVSSSIFHYHLS